MSNPRGSITRNKQNRRKILDRFYGDPPSNVYGLILAETWGNQSSIINWWNDKGDLKHCQKWNDKGICGNMDDWKFDSLDVSSSYVNDDETLEPTKIYILYAYKKLD